MELQSLLEEFRRKKIVIAVISVDPPQVTESWQTHLPPQDQALHLPLLSDETRKVTRAYGVYELKKDVALPAVFLIDQKEGKIRWKKVGRTIKDRVSESEIRQAVLEVFFASES